MQYGYFDDKSKEYVITRPDTPRSWCNYLGTTEYGAIITNNAGGYSFYRSSARGRFIRFRANTVPMDQPGRYFYIRDVETDDYWSASWQPVGKPLEKYRSVCRHGTAYTIIESEYDGIKTVSTYFVPLDKIFEVWMLKIRNNDRKRRKLRIFTFVEYSNNWYILQDWINLQYTQHIVCMKYVDGMIDHGINVFLPDSTGDFDSHDGNRHTWLGLVGEKVTGYDTDREVFIGPYRSYNNPSVVEKGECENSIAVGDNSCGVLQVDIEFEPGEEREFAVLMGIGKAETEGKRTTFNYDSVNKLHDEFNKLKEYWHNRIENLEVETPDKEFNSMVNVWNPYNCMVTYAWSRSASIVYSGERDGLGYRDTVQDMLGVLHLIPDEARQRLELMITGQVSTGGAIPVVNQFTHKPGQEKPPREEEYRSDDCTWLFVTIPAYVKETGDINFYEKVLPYADKGHDTVLGHMKKSIEFNLQRRGAHGLPCGLFADWNDCLELGHDGETVFVAMQLRYALITYIEICELLKKNEEVNWARKHLKELDECIEKYAWDGDWYIRAYRYDGMKFGSKENDEGKIWLNPQTWAILSGHATGKRAEKLLNIIRKKLFTEYGFLILDPPYVKTDHKIIKAVLFNKGMKENASIFNHTQGWAVISAAILGKGNEAYEYLRAFLPAYFNSKAEVREVEPYVHCQFTHSKYSPRFGAGRIPWLTGSASWTYYAISQYILGIRPDYYGLIIDPCIPSHWKEIKIKRNFRNKKFEITIDNHKGIERGIKRLVVNGEKLSSNMIPIEIMKEENVVLAEMG